MAQDAFTTVALVRIETGLVNETNVTDPRIDPFVRSANAKITSAIAARYTLPLGDNTYYSGSSAEDDLIRIATQYASGLLLLSQFAETNEEMEDVAKVKLNIARAEIKGYQDGKTLLNGSDSNSLEVAGATENYCGGMKDDSTPAAQNSMDDRY